MKNIITLLLGLFISTISLAANYEPIPNGYTLEFGYPEMLVSIDSVKTINDSVFTYPSHSIIELNEYEENCLSPKTSVLGNKYYYKNNNIVFYNHKNEPILIKTNYPISTEWVAYSNDTITIKAQIENCIVTNELGKTDSVLTILFKSYNKSSTPINYELSYGPNKPSSKDDIITINYEQNCGRIKLSKNHGIFQTINFAAFPKHSGSKELILKSITPNNKFNNLTWSEVFDINIGDEIHTKENYFNVVYSNQIEETTYTIKKYLKKEIKSDTIIFKIDRKRKIVSTINYVETITYYRDTIIEKIVEIPIFNTRIYKPICISPFEYINLRPTVALNNTGKIIPSYDNEFSITNVFDSCWYSYYNAYNSCNYGNNYYKGLGGPYYSGDGNSCAISSEPVYYKKGKETAGTPIVITKTDEQKGNALGTIYPNPTSSRLFVRTKIANLIEIYDLKGELIKKVELIFPERDTEIYIYDLEPGTYFYKLTDSRRKSSSGELIIE